jgi:hypothetical protein
MIVLATVGLVLIALPAEVSAQEKFRCGSINILGNETTHARVILKAIDFYPGQTITARDLRRAEFNLMRLGLFEVDPGNGVRPTVTVEDPIPGSEFSDVTIRIKERPGNWPRAEACLIGDYLATGEFDGLLREAHDLGGRAMRQVLGRLR